VGEDGRAAFSIAAFSFACVWGFLRARRRMRILARERAALAAPRVLPTRAGVARGPSSPALVRRRLFWRRGHTA